MLHKNSNWSTQINKETRTCATHFTHYIIYDMKYSKRRKFDLQQKEQFYKNIKPMKTIILQEIFSRGPRNREGLLFL